MLRLSSGLALCILLTALYLAVFSYGPPCADAADVEIDLASERASFDLLESPGEFTSEVRDATPCAQNAARVTVLDNLLIDGSTWLVLALLAVTIALHGTPISRVLGLLLLVAGSTAALLACAENVHLYQGLAGTAPTVVVPEAYSDSLGMWWGVFATTAVGAIAFFASSEDVMWAYGGVCFGAALTGAAGLLWYPWAVEWAFAMLVVPYVAVLWMCLRTPALLLEELTGA